MDWEVVKVRHTTRSRSEHSKPAASVGFGRLSINLAACNLVENYEECQSVELLRGRHKNKACVGVRFMLPLETSVDSLPIRRKLRNGKPTGGIDINGKRIMEQLFGPAASANTITKYSVVRDEHDKNILVIFAE